MPQVPRQRSAASSNTAHSFRALCDLAQIAPEATWIESESGQTLFANDAVAEIWGIPATQLCTDNTALRRAIHPDDRALADYDSPTIPDHRIVRPSGESRCVRLHVAPVTDAEGRRLRIFSARDISDLRHAIDDLRRGESDYRLLIETQEQMIVKVDSNGMLLYVSPTYCDMFGQTEQELLGRVFMPAVHEEDREATLQAMEQLHRPPYTCYVEQRAMTRHGWRWLAWNDKAAVNERGEILYIVGVGRDITDRRRHREELAQAMADAQRANREKDKFLAMLSHELRTPLTPVLASVSAIEQDHSLPPELSDTLQMIRRNIELESRLIDDLLDLTRISRGKLRLDPHLVDARELLETALSVCMPDIQGKSLRLIRESLATHTKVFADPSRLQQVFWNVIRNAVQFTPPAGQVAIKTWNNRDSFVLQVSDSGEGINPEFLPRIFDAFEQEKRDHRSGLGLGLAISRTVLDLHGGTITAESRGLHQGSRFTMTIPLADVDHVENPATPGSKPASLRILLVEDHAATLQVLRRLLNKLGHDVTTAMTLQSAMQAVADQEFDLLISDIGLPDGSGLDLMRYVRQTRPMAGIALSGFGMDQDIAQSREAGFNAHLTKPVGVSLLVQTITDVVKEQNPHRGSRP